MQPPATSFKRPQTKKVAEILKQIAAHKEQADVTWHALQKSATACSAYAMPAAAKNAVLGMKIGAADGFLLLLLPGIGKVSGCTAAIMLGMSAWSVNYAGCLAAMPGVPSDIHAELLRDGKLSGNVASELQQVLRQADELNNDL